MGTLYYTKSDFHYQIAQLLDFGSYYGNNLDALWDRLSCDVPRSVLLVWNHSAESKKALGDVYFEDIIEILERTK